MAASGAALPVQDALLFNREPLRAPVMCWALHARSLPSRDSLLCREVETQRGLLQWLSGKGSTCNAGGAGDVGLIPGSGSSLGGGHGNPLQDSCLEHPVDRRAWQVTVHSISKSDTSEATQHACMRAETQGLQTCREGFPCGSVVRNLPANAENMGSIPNPG